MNLESMKSLLRFIFIFPPKFLTYPLSLRVTFLIKIEE